MEHLSDEYDQLAQCQWTINYNAIYVIDFCDEPVQVHWLVVNCSLGYGQWIECSLQGPTDRVAISERESSQDTIMDDYSSGVVKCGGYRYEDGTRFIGDWNKKGQKHGLGHYLLPDGTRYDGAFTNGLCSGLGVLRFADGAK